MRKLHFKTEIAHVKHFYSVLLQVLCHSSNASLSDTDMAWAPDTQRFFLDAESTDRYPGINFRFADSDHTLQLTAKLVRGFRIRHGDNFLAYQRDILSWLGVLYRIYIPIGQHGTDHGFADPETIVVNALTGVKFLAPRTANHFMSCWIYVCRFYFAFPQAPALFPAACPLHVLREASFFSTAIGYGLGGVASLGSDLMPKTIESTLFSGATIPVPSYTALAAPADCKTAATYPLEFLDGFVDEYVKIRSHNFDDDADDVDPFTPLGRRKAVSQQPDASFSPHPPEKRARGVGLGSGSEPPPPPPPTPPPPPSVPYRFWRPPVFTKQDRDSVLVYGGGAVGDKSFQVLSFCDQYSHLFQRTLTQSVLATDGRFWQSTDESRCRGLSELSTLHQIGMALLFSPASLTSIWFFFTVVFTMIESAFPSSATTEVYWSYVAVLVRKFARVSGATTADGPRHQCIATWRISIAAFAAWMRLPVDTATARSHVNRLFLLWLPYSHQVFSDVRSPNLKDTLNLIESVAVSPKCNQLLGVSLVVDVFQHFYISLPEPRFIPFKTLLPENNPDPFGQYVWRVNRQNRLSHAMLPPAPLSPPPVGQYIVSSHS